MRTRSSGEQQCGQSRGQQFAGVSVSRMGVDRSNRATKVAQVFAGHRDCLRALAESFDELWKKQGTVALDGGSRCVSDDIRKRFEVADSLFEKIRHTRHHIDAPDVKQQVSCGLRRQWCRAGDGGTTESYRSGSAFGVSWRVSECRSSNAFTRLALSQASDRKARVSSSLRQSCCDHRPVTRIVPLRPTPDWL